MSEQQRKCPLCSCSVDKYWYCTAEHEIKIACSNIVCPLNFSISRGGSVAYLPLVKDWDILFQDSNFQRTANWLKACGKEPSPEHLSVQIGCMIEEFCNLLRIIHIDGIHEALNVLEDASEDMKNRQKKVFIRKNERAECLNSLCYLEVTLNGVAYLSGFNKPAADQTILKLVDGKPVILEGGKIGKPEGWVPPNLSEFV